ncbi:MAG: hypothetical protein M1421_00750 [Candidatus Eremiobacteraeota bacterium]|jgi:hypothetical protein|nr:hypothetical protein [Candidatus Eremiobacteraeota bacterium]MCL5054690.1 hypothetical protein [Bacillota bacterium]
MPIYLDPWNPEFSSSLQAEQPEEGSSPDIRLDVESIEWKAVKPELIPADFIFVDGVRRVESRVIYQNGKLFYGVFGSAAAGGIWMKKAQLNLTQNSLVKSLVRRYLITGGGILPFDHEISMKGLNFLPVSIPDEDHDSPVQKLQQLMRDQEGEVIHELAEKNLDSLLIADGPLHFPWAKKNPVLGYIKSFHEWYLPAPYLGLLTELRVSERTPIFLISGQTSRFPDRFSWFVRLSKPGSGDSPLSGLARLETSCDFGLEKAHLLANSSCLLSFYGASRERDPRSPQNLLPIGILEGQLKHLLGDSGIVKRSIHSWIFISAQKSPSAATHSAI